MQSFKRDFLAVMRLSPASSWLVGACMEARGKQELWKQTKPEVLERLRETAIVQSAESSNRIEGVSVQSSRLIPLLGGSTAPRDRSEEEVLGYKKTLDLIFKDYADLEITPKTIRKLHLLSQGGVSADAGEWKMRNNEIIEVNANGERTIRFVPVPPENTAFAIEQLCYGFAEVSDQRSLPDLIAIAAFVLDFLCIHPFRDGNGRVSRLLALLLLIRSNYEIGRYISLERLVEASKDRYYETLKMSSESWHEGRHAIEPFLNFFCAILKEGYGELAIRVNFKYTQAKLLTKNKSRDIQKRKYEESHPAPLSGLIEQHILSQISTFALKDIKSLCPTASEQLVKKILYRMKQERRVKLEGRGRAARWRLRQ